MALLVLPKMLAAVAQFVTFAGFVVIVAGLAKLQKTTNASSSLIKADLRETYDTTFNEALLTPYPDAAGFQFSFIWFIIFFQFTMLLMTLAVTLVPAVMRIGRAAALTLLASAFTLTINVVNNLVFLHRNTAARTVYGSRDINVTLAGAILVVLGNAFTILTVGTLVSEAAPVATHSRSPAEVAGKREADVAI